MSYRGLAWVTYDVADLTCDVNTSVFLLPYFSCISPALDQSLQAPGISSYYGAVNWQHFLSISHFQIGAMSDKLPYAFRAVSPHCVVKRITF
jgi:hypothetical protein